MNQARYLTRKISEQKSIKPTKKTRYQQAKQAEPDNLIIGMMPRTWRSGSGPCSKKKRLKKLFQNLTFCRLLKGKVFFWTGKSVMNLIRTVLGSPDVDEGVRRWANRLKNVVFWKAATSHRGNPSLMGENQARLRASAAAGDPRFGEGFCLCQERMQKLKGSSWSSHLFRQVGKWIKIQNFLQDIRCPQAGGWCIEVSSYKLIEFCSIIVVMSCSIAWWHEQSMMMWFYTINYLSG